MPNCLLPAALVAPIMDGTQRTEVIAAIGDRQMWSAVTLMGSGHLISGFNGCPQIAQIVLLRSTRFRLRR